MKCKHLPLCRSTCGAHNILCDSLSASLTDAAFSYILYANAAASLLVASIHIHIKKNSLSKHYPIYYLFSSLECPCRNDVEGKGYE